MSTPLLGQARSWPGKSWGRSLTRIASLPGALRRGWASPAAVSAACRLWPETRAPGVQPKAANCSLIFLSCAT